MGTLAFPLAQLFRRACQQISAQPSERNASWTSARLGANSRVEIVDRRAAVIALVGDDFFDHRGVIGDSGDRLGVQSPLGSVRCIVVVSP